MAGDGSMSLGEHLHELRTRLVRVIVVLVVVMIGSFFLIDHIQPILRRPLEQAAAMIGDATVHGLGHDNRHDLAQFHNRGLTDGPFALLRISMYMAFTAAFPVLVWQLWGFIVPGLHMHERKAGFLLVPAAVIFFYLGLIFGYFIGLPYLYKWIFEFSAAWNEGTKLELFQGDYYDNFFMMIILFGGVMDIPWLVMVLVKARLVTPDKLSRYRKHIIFGAAIASAVLTPPDPFSQLMVLGMMVALFEAGLWASRLLYARRDATAAAGATSATPGADGLIGHLIDLPPTDRDPPGRNPDRDPLGRNPERGPLGREDAPAEPAGTDRAEPDAAPPPSAESTESPTEPAEEGTVAATDPTAPPTDPWAQGRPRKDLHRHRPLRSGRPGRAGTGDGPDVPDKDPEHG